MSDSACLLKLDSSKVASVSSNAKFNIHSNFDHLRYLSIRRYFHYIVNEGLGKMEASRRACLVIVADPRDYLSRCIRVWASYFAANGTLPAKNQGKHVKHFSPIHNEDVALECRKIFRSIKRNLRTSQLFADKVHRRWPNITISQQTAAKWLNQLGFEPSSLKKTTYTDKHEDVAVKAERTAFCTDILAYHEFMPSFVGPNMIEVLSPKLGVPVIKRFGFDGRPFLFPVSSYDLWNQDESNFDSTTGKTKPWIEKGRAPMAPRRGESRHVSGIVSPRFGVISTVEMSAGKNKDGYWRCCHLVDQVDAACMKYKLAHPGVMVLAQFDNSGNHKVYARDALIASRLNLGDGYPALNAGDKEAGIESASFRKTKWQDEYGEWHDQNFEFNFVDKSGKAWTQHKGIRRILTERGLFRESKGTYVVGGLRESDGVFFVGKRNGPLAHVLPVGFSGPQRKPGDTVVVGRMLAPEAERVLDAQPDFVAQKGKYWLTETMEKHGFRCSFGVRYHPELALIEYFWGQCKKWTRSHCDYSWEGLLKEVPVALKSVTIETIRRFYNHVFRYVRAYVTGTLSLEQVQWAMRKYTSHRRVHNVDMDELDANFLTADYMKDMPMQL